MSLDGPRLDAASGTISSLVIFLHGYGADGNDLLGLGSEWARALPNTEFVSPHAPEVCIQNAQGRQWWDLSDRSDEARWAGVQRAAPRLDAFIDAEIKRTGLPASRIALVGFSQGTMMALHVGLRRADRLGAIVGYSGVIAGAEHLGAQIRSRPPVFLAHGTLDQVIPVDALVQTVEALAENGVPRKWHVAHGMAHGIDRVGLAAAADFLNSALSTSS
ncbi:alpha/beta hydrolase [Terrihabitans sp. B22-R8]|uniref:alpha/beta hydrolase n=1 Tax=Terrihabitans sp. B22-R8 TaxID=3425128 RepID=UPI00403C7695